MSEATVEPRPNSASWAALGATALAAGYVAVFVVTGEGRPWLIAAHAVANAAPAVLLAFGAAQVLRSRRFRAADPSARALAHAGLAALFAGGWWLLAALTIGLVGALDGRPLRPEFLTGAALPWQLFQGLTVYGFVVALTSARPEPAPVVVQPSAVRRRWLLRKGDEIVPVAAEDIVSIRGADDYAEVFTQRGRYLARTTLAEFERRLDPELFVRVHRSCIVNLDRLLAAEPDGAGRMALHLADGETVTVSRAGAQALRRRVV